MPITRKDKDHIPVPPEFEEIMQQFFSIRCRYEAAIREVQTKLEILDMEFQTKHDRNPIHHMQSRLKSFPSTLEKLQRRGIPVSFDSMTQTLMDIAGVRVICSYIEDVYAVADLLIHQDDVRLVRKRDYIRHPKENGYRSLHLVIEIPVYLQRGKILVPVEVQLRTIAMDLWASLEHQMRYKGVSHVPANIADELQSAADGLAALDERMQSIHQQLNQLPDD
ncbi:MAG: GTP pyrophosphokinase family protein [Clostridia bacterium]|nr:GTP pyrophosphokinase family protein [Clostridia bacterium]